MTKIAITGARGFLGWHLACRIRAVMGVDPATIDRATFDDRAALAAEVANVDVVFHLAGVNRAGSDEDVECGNVMLAERLAQALDDRPVHVVYANSIHAEADTPYGRGKRRAAELLAGLPGTFADVRLPNLFGEHGRPDYNSFVATFCHEVAHDRAPTVTNDRPLPLMHAQTAAQALIDAAARSESDVTEPMGEEHLISEVLNSLRTFHETYRSGGEIPDLSTSFATDLFNTYRSYLFPQLYPIHPVGHEDNRGVLYEVLRAHGGQGQAYVSTTAPGATRGEHYHLRKVERFFVVQGEAEIQLRRLLHDDIVTFRLSGSRPAIVDMPTLWVHNIRNVGDEDVVTMFWSNQLLDPEQPDQFHEKVEVSA